MALCLNPKCQKRVADGAVDCRFCGGTEISEFNSYSKAEALVDELSMENFQKVIKSSQPFIERTIIQKGAKVSFKSKLVVRIQYFVRKIFRRN